MSKPSKKMIWTILAIVGITVVFIVMSQMYSADEQIFITDQYAITPKTQPHLFVLMWFVNIGIFIFALWLGKFIAVFLWEKGVLLHIVGVFLIFAAGILGYVFFVVQENYKTTSDLLGSLFIILFPSGFGFLMLFNSIFSKKKSR